MSGDTITQREQDAKNHRLYVATKPKNLTPAITHGNASMTEPYVGNRMASPRADADSHFSILSRGYV